MKPWEIKRLAKACDVAEGHRERINEVVKNIRDKKEIIRIVKNDEAFESYIQ